jgi:hypothetical protein
MNHHPVACCTYKAGAAEHVLSYHFSLLPSHHLLLLYYIVLTLPSMATDSITNPLSPISHSTMMLGDESRAESTTMTNSSSRTCGTALMAKGEIPELTDFIKGATVSEEELQAYHSHGWLTGNVLSSIPKVEVPTIIDSTVLCFESHLLARLGLPPSKFLAPIMNYLICSLVHFNVNAIAALGSFVMLEALSE